MSLTASLILRLIFVRTVGRSTTRELNAMNCIVHIRGVLPWPPRCRRWVWPRRVRLVVWRVRLGQECLGERVEHQVQADPARRQGVALVEREVRAWVRRVEQFRGRLRPVLGDEDHAGAGRRVTGLCCDPEVRQFCKWQVFF